jgi:hypothetical protein
MKYKILGFTIVGFILLALYFFFNAKEPINPILFEANNMDSIRIRKTDNIKILTNTSDLINVVEQLKKCKEVSIDRANINTGFVDLSFFTKKRKEPYPIRILFNYYHGILITNFKSYYKNDSLYTSVMNYLKTSSVIVN